MFGPGGALLSCSKDLLSTIVCSPILRNYNQKNQWHICYSSILIHQREVLYDDNLKHYYDVHEMIGYTILYQRGLVGNGLNKKLMRCKPKRCTALKDVARSTLGGKNFQTAGRNEILPAQKS